MCKYKKKHLKTGVTTGASAAAAAKAAVVSLLNNTQPTLIKVLNPDGDKIEVPIDRYINSGNGKTAVVIKDGGDDPDITHGLEITASVTLTTHHGIFIRGGQGVGTVTKPGLKVPVGKPAINPVPEWMIRTALSEALPENTGCIVTISIPDGEKVAGRTLNPRLGITGGISILGTTGIVVPMSEEAYKESLLPQIDMAIAVGHTNVILTPGRMGAKSAAGLGIPDTLIVQMSNFVGYMLDKCVEKGIKNVILLGHHGKLIKVAAGIFHTHSKIADARQEIYAALAGAAGAGPLVINSILQCTTAESILGIIYAEGLKNILPTAAARASARAEIYVRGELTVGTVLLSINGEILALDDSARSLGRELGWAL